MRQGDKVEIHPVYGKSMTYVTCDRVGFGTISSNIKHLGEFATG